MKSLMTITISFSIYALASSPLSCAAGADVVPKDFKATAVFSAPDILNWEVRILSDGKAMQIYRDINQYEKTGEPEVRKTLQLTEKDLKDLFDKIREAKFMSLPRGDTRLGGEDAPTYSLSVTIDGETHEAGPAGGLGKEQQDRFFKVFAEILRKVPSPHPDQKPEDFDPEPVVKPMPVPPRKSLPHQ